MNARAKERKFRIPDFETAFEARRSAFSRSLSAAREVSDWWRERSELPRDHFERRVAQSMLVFAELFFPDCRREERFWLLARWAGYLFVWDDHNECGVGFGRNSAAAAAVLAQYVECVQKLETNEEFNTECKTYVSCVFAFSRQIIGGMNGRQRTRFLSSWRQWLDAQQRENQLFEAEGREEWTLEDIQTLRLSGSANDTIFALLEFALEVDVSDDEWNDDRVQRMRVLCNLAIIYINDVYSYEKEMEEQNADNERVLCNSVAFFVLREKMSVREAMERVLAMNATIESEFLALYDVVMRSSLSLACKQYLNGLKAMIGGNLEMSRTLDRYNAI